MTLGAEVFLEATVYALHSFKTWNSGKKEKKLYVDTRPTREKKAQLFSFYLVLILN